MSGEPTEELCAGVGEEPVGAVAEPVYLSASLALRHRFGTCPVCHTSVRLAEDGMIGPHKLSTAFDR
jgi:hypothetical protein